jgi:hypothetical protein
MRNHPEVEHLFATLEEIIDEPGVGHCFICKLTHGIEDWGGISKVIK